MSNHGTGWAKEETGISAMVVSLAAIAAVAACHVGQSHRDLEQDKEGDVLEPFQLDGVRHH